MGGGRAGHHLAATGQGSNGDHDKGQRDAGQSECDSAVPGRPVGDLVQGATTPPSGQVRPQRRTFSPQR